ncbi:MAG: nucleotidyltransferase family protein [Rhodobacteraceae bacterium]|nr:nucleotidyltransferase family protein [Paracoccaceae bacterium]
MDAARTNRITDLLRRDRRRWRALGLVAALGLPQGCIGAGFLRNLVWDHRHARRSDCRDADIDVLFFDPRRTDPAYEADIEARLRSSAPDLQWSVRNQARMHRRNHDAPYASVEDAMRFWPETATAVAAMRAGEACAIIAPFGLADLDGLILRPPSAAPHRIAAFRARVAARNWRARWPKLQVMDAADQA